MIHTLKSLLLKLSLVLSRSLRSTMKQYTRAKFPHEFPNRFDARHSVPDILGRSALCTFRMFTRTHENRSIRWGSTPNVASWREGPTVNKPTGTRLSLLNALLFPLPFFHPSVYSYSLLNTDKGAGRTNCLHTITIWQFKISFAKLRCKRNSFPSANSNKCLTKYIN